MSGKAEVQEALVQLEAFCRGLPRDSNAIEIRKQVRNLRETWEAYKRRQRFEPVKDWLWSKRMKLKKPSSYTEFVASEVLDALLEEASKEPRFLLIICAWNVKTLHRF